MRLNSIKAVLQLTACLLLVAFTSAQAATPPQSMLPRPVLYFIGQETFEQGGKTWVRYRYNVDNFSAYPNTMFAPAPALPPCGTNRRSSRTWVDIYNQSGKRLMGFCAFDNASDLNRIWFALEADEIPPSWVYIELNDRQTSTMYKSNLAETTL